MRWFVFFMLLMVLLTLQTTLATRLAWMGVRPDWLLILVVFIAFHADRRDAVIAGWCVGFCADLMSIERLGVIALTYSLIALAIVSTRDALFRYRWTTHVLVTFLACILVRTAWTAYRTTMYDTDDSLMSDLGVNVLAVSLYTALWAPLFHSTLQRMGKWLGFKMPRYSYRGARRLVSRNV